MSDDDAAQPTAEEEERPRGDLFVRSAQVTDIRFGQRLIELVVMPYDEVTLVERQGRMVRESCAPGAFANIQRRNGRVKVNRDHDLQRPCGKAITFHPSRTEGLVAELRMARTPLGEETLELADEGILDASAGFLPMPGGEEWRTRDEVRLTRVWLGHIAMTPDPAYAGAQVLSVRSAEPPVPISAYPNRDAINAFLLEQRYAGL